MHVVPQVTAHEEMHDCKHYYKMTFVDYYTKTTDDFLQMSQGLATNVHTVAPSNNKEPTSCSLISACSRHMSVVLHAHPVRGESHIHHNAN